MQLVFTKGSAKHDWLGVVRDGHACERIECPKQGIIPHDMVHYAVEQSLQRRGFLTRILDGEAAAFQMAAESESEAVERLVEVFQADGWSGWNSAATELLDLYRVTCAARHCEPLMITANDIDVVRCHLLELTAQWERLPVGQSVALPFEQPAVAASPARL